MEKPVLVIMAAGMGSRYGGLKQIDPVDEQGHLIIDFSIYDAWKAGFEKVIFIIKKEHEEVFREVIGDRVSQTMKVEYAFQEIDNLPKGYSVPAGRTKPWGTGHAVLSAAPYIHGPFAVINADDYYGTHAFSMIYNYLSNFSDNSKMNYAMVSYILDNTLSDNGYVSRGVCSIGENQYLEDVVERTKIVRTKSGAAFSQDGGNTWTDIPLDTQVSMNLWGFGESFLEELKARFPIFLEKNIPSNPLKCEYFLPTVAAELVKEKKATVKVLPSKDRWYGVTYKEDKQTVVNAVKKMKEAGIYPVAF